MIGLCLVLCCMAAFVAFDRMLSVRNALLKSVLAFWFALALLSFGFSLSLFAGLPLWIFETVFVLLPAGFLFREIKMKGYSMKPLRIESVPFPVLLVILAGLCWFSYNMFTASERWGSWDAWAIWSQHAHFLASGAEFDNLFTDKIAWTHPDYPLMLPSLIAMWWNAFGFSAYAPAVLGCLISVSLLLAIVGFFLEKKQTILGLALFLTLACSKVLFPFVTMQCADTLTALFILIPLILLYTIPEDKPLETVFLAGFFAASCSWVKNEGLMFFVLFAVFFGVKYFRRNGFLKYFSFGIALPLVVLLLFKIGYAPSNDLVNSHEQSYMDKLGDASRYQLIFDYIYIYFKDNCELLYYSLLAILLINYRFYYSTGFLLLFALFTSYFLAYVISPNDLTWHLSTSFDRLVHQIFPALLCLIFYSASERTKFSFHLKVNRKINH